MGEQRAKLPSLVDYGAQLLFEKILTSSDANAQGRVIIPKAQAIQHLPPFEKEAVEVPCLDTLGNYYVFRLNSWINNQSRMYLLEGTQDLQALYGVHIGDALCFGRSVTGDLIVCGRKRDLSPTLKSGQSSDKIIVSLDKNRRRRKPANHADSFVSNYNTSKVPTDPLIIQYDPVLDGVFRILPTNSAPPQAEGVQEEMGLWVAYTLINGEFYKAYFQTNEMAVEACVAIGLDGYE